MSIEGAKLLDYWVHKKERFPREQLENIDIHGVHKASKLVSWERQRWIAKFLSGWTASGSAMVRWNKRIVDVCPRCGAKKEDTKHILECKAPEAVEIWILEIDKLDKWLKSEATCPQLRKAIIESLSKWKLGVHHTSHIDTNFTGLKVGLAQQSKLGWRRFVEGTVTKKWREIQELYYKSMSIPKTSDGWVARLIVRMWDIVYIIWQHRNSVLHNTPMADIMGGSYILEQSLRNEWDLGFAGLSPIVRATIPRTIAKVMEGTTLERKGWFVLIRRARELQPHCEIEDEFSDPKSGLRKWVGL